MNGDILDLEHISTTGKFLTQVLSHACLASSLLVALPAHAGVPTDVVANIATTIPGKSQHINITSP